MESLVSVIIPIYNVEEYLDKCIESIVHQTYGNLEIILVDDGSPDTCPQKCDAWATKDSRVKVIHKANAGIGFARNSGLDIASGACIMFVDPDDYLASDAIEVMVNIMKRDHSDLVVAQKVKVYADGTEEPSAYTWMCEDLVEKDEAMRMIGSKVRPMPASAGAKLYRKMIFDNFRFSSVKTAEDTYALPHIIDQCNTISFTDKVVYFYFQRDTSVVHTMTREKSLDNIRAVLHVARYLFDRNYINEAKLYYNSAVCQVIKLKRDKEATQLIRDCFSRPERRVLRKGRDMTTMATLLIAHAPNTYKLYKSIRNIGCTKKR